MNKKLQERINSIPNTEADIFKPSIIIMSETDSDMLLVESKRKLGTYKTLGGRIEKGETILECIQREMLEEMGTDKVRPTEILHNTGLSKSHDEDLTVELEFYRVEVEEQDFYSDIQNYFNPEENVSCSWHSIKTISESVDQKYSKQLIDLAKRILARQK